MSDVVVVWGNCQAPPLAELLTAPMSGHGLRVVRVPPVFELDEAGVARVRALVRRAAVLVTHPIRDEYRVPGCGSAQLAALLPLGGRVVTVASAFHVGPFPYVAHGHDARGIRVDAPVTTYHDLRLVARALGHPTPAPTTAALRAVDEASRAELRRREADLDVPVSAEVVVPGAMFTVNHPANAVLAATARGVLRALGLTGEVDVPAREFLGATRAPVGDAVATALGWSARPGWRVDGQEVADARVAAAHLAFYRDRPEVATDTWTRYAARRALLGL